MGRKRKQLRKRGNKGLALFASDIAHTATTMDLTVAIQTNPLLTDAPMSIETVRPDDFKEGWTETQ